VLATDQLTKHVILSTLTLGQSLPIIPSVLHLTYVQNTGAAFGLFENMTAVLAVLSCLAAAWIVRELRTGRMRHDDRIWALALVLGGAIGNLIDRTVYGYVVDFIDLRVWPVFNMADAAITIGVLWLLIPAVLQRRRNS